MGIAKQIFGQDDLSERTFTNKKDMLTHKLTVDEKIRKIFDNSAMNSLMSIRGHECISGHSFAYYQ